MNFIKKNLSNILFVGFIIFLFTPYGLPVRAVLIRGVSMVTTRVFSLEKDANEQVVLDSYQWDLIDEEGNRVPFESFKERIVLVNFWATWCPPCVAEMPGLQDLYDRYGDEISFVFVTNDKKQRVLDFMKNKNYSFPVYFEVSRPPAPMTSKSLPSTYIIDQSGKVVVEKVGAADWNSAKVHRLLESLLQ